MIWSDERFLKDHSAVWRMDLGCGRRDGESSEGKAGCREISWPSHCVHA